MKSENALLGMLMAGLAAAFVGSRAADPAPAATAPAPGGGAPPIGTIVAFGGPPESAPEAEGWLLCDGRELPVSAYRELHAAIGFAWGKGDRGQSFRIPDLRGRFLRGVALGAEDGARDPDAMFRAASAPGGNEGDNVGTLQEDSVGPHQHALVGVADATGPGFGAEWIQFRATKIPDADAPLVSNLAAVQSAGSATETRPRNVAVNWIIRAR